MSIMPLIIPLKRNIFLPCPKSQLTVTSIFFKNSLSKIGLDSEGLPNVPYLELLIHEYFGKIINLFKKYDITCVFVLARAI